MQHPPGKPVAGADPAGATVSDSPRERRQPTDEAAGLLERVSKLEQALAAIIETPSEGVEGAEEAAQGGPVALASVSDTIAAQQAEDAAAAYLRLEGALEATERQFETLARGAAGVQATLSARQAEIEVLKRELEEIRAIADSAVTTENRLSALTARLAEVDTVAGRLKEAVRQHLNEIDSRLTGVLETSHREVWRSQARAKSAREALKIERRRRREDARVLLAGLMRDEQRTQALESAVDAALSLEGDRRVNERAIHEEWAQTFEAAVQTMLSIEGVRRAGQRAIREERAQTYSAAFRKLSLPRRRNRLAKLIERALCRLRSPGVALAISRAGVWSKNLWAGSMRDQPKSSLLSYAKAGANPSAHPLSLFDQAFYLANNPDVARGRLSPLAHYLVAGDAEGRSPHPLVSAPYYRANNRNELGATGLTVLQHFLLFGQEGRDPHPLFDVMFYIGQLHGPESAQLNPLVHYLRIGWRRGLNPHPLFDNDWYLKRYPDVGAAMIPPLLHYLEFGAAEGRDPHPLFFGRWYEEAYPDVRESGVNPLEHFVTRALPERRNPNPFFSTDYYLNQAAGGPRIECNPLVHYIEQGAWLGLSTREDLDSRNMIMAAGLSLDERTPLEAWLRLVDPEDLGRGTCPPVEDISSRVAMRNTSSRDAEPPQTSTAQPSRLDWAPWRSLIELLFDEAFYREQAGALLAPDQDALEHYMRFGWRAGLDPHPLFDAVYYLETNPDVVADGAPPLLHFVRFGAAEDRNPHPLFDMAWYSERHPDVVSKGENPLVHFIAFGAAERRDPNPNFSIAEYLHRHPEVAASGINPLIHYLQSESDEEETSGDGLLPLVENPTELIVKQGDALASRIDAVSADLKARLTPDLSPSPNLLYTSLAKTRGSPTVDTYDLAAYEVLSHQLEEDRINRLGSARRAPRETIQIGAADVDQAAVRIAFSRPPAPLASVMVVGFNRLAATVACLATLARTEMLHDIEVIFVDDGSFDRTGALLPTTPGLRYIRHMSRQGVVKARNRAASEARGDVLVFLDTDIQVQPDWLASLIPQAMASGVATPRIVGADGHLYAAGARLLTDGTVERIGDGDDPDASRYRSDRTLDAVPGACFAVRRDLFEQASGLDVELGDPDLAAADLCLRLGAAGRHARLAPASEVVRTLKQATPSMSATHKERLIERWSGSIAAANRVKILAFYHPQDENSLGEGGGPATTEWNDVAQALPNFLGHLQPKRPSELGFYDSSDIGVLERQAKLALEHGVDGFVHHYSWSGDEVRRRLPLQRLLDAGRRGFPFALCWDNGGQSRGWIHAEQERMRRRILEKGDEDRFFAEIAECLQAESYVRVDGRPLLAVSRPGLVPDIQRVTDRWRELARQAGLGSLYLAFVETAEYANTYTDPARFGFDAAIELPPAGAFAPVAPSGPVINPDFHGEVHDYWQMARDFLARPVPSHRRLRGAMPSWDNTALRQNDPHIFAKASPGAFQAWLEALLEETRRQASVGERIVFVNAWNNWLEGAHLEPDAYIGRGWLEAVKNAHEAAARRQSKC